MVRRGIHVTCQLRRPIGGEWILLITVSLVGTCLAAFALFSDVLETFFSRLYGLLD